MADPAGYSGTPLPRKLGVKDGHRVLLVAAPDGFELGPLPGGVEVVRAPAVRGRARGAAAQAYDVVVDFCPDHAALVASFAPLAEHLPVDAALWVAWPKKASGVASDLDDNVVRRHGLDVGLVDVKVAAIDAVWSGEKFVYRLVDRPQVSARRSVSRTQA
jgi:hypothetical protein